VTGASWTRGLLPLAASLLLVATLVVLARRWEPGLADWARAPGTGWGLLGLAGYVAAGFLAVRSFPLLRDGKLYAWTLLLLPLGAAQFLAAGRLVDGSWADPMARLDGWTTLLLPLVTLGAALVPQGLPARTLRLVTLGAACALCGGAAALAWFAPPLEAVSWAPGALTLTGVVAGGVALGVWRTDGGLGGAAAGACALVLMAGLGRTGTGLTPLLEQLYLRWQLFGLDDVALGRFPEGTDRLLLLVLPLGLVVVVAREWIVNLSHRTSLDTLTRLYNKDYARSIVEQTGMCDLGSCFSIAVADIDHFKKVNDTHGHGAGDVVLHEVAQGIRDAVGARGVVCRTGGEEITIFYPFLALAEAKTLCERVRVRVEKLQIRVVNNERRKQRLSVTLSIGVASNQPGGEGAAPEGVSDVVQAADKAVYQAKHRGRNRVVAMGD
jgi:diguanylate cyclase (GGDEF)-like protein